MSNDRPGGMDNLKDHGNKPGLPGGASDVRALGAVANGKIDSGDRPTKDGADKED